MAPAMLVSFSVWLGWRMRHLPRYRMPISGVIRTHSQNSKYVMGNDANYLIGFESCIRKGGIIRPWREREWLKRGRITPAVAVVIGAQESVFFKKILFF